MQSRDEHIGENRWSGASLNPNVPNSGGIYFSLQQQALVNEMRHLALVNKMKYPVGILQIRVNQVLKLVDLSEANPQSRDFAGRVIRAAGLLPPTAYPPFSAVQWRRFFGDDDCSVPRGLGLAVAASEIYQGIIAPTVRLSERSEFERGDNLVLYAPDGIPYPGLIAEAAFFTPGGHFFGADLGMTKYPVQFP